MAPFTGRRIAYAFALQRCPTCKGYRASRRERCGVCSGTGWVTRPAPAVQWCYDRRRALGTFP